MKKTITLKYDMWGCFEHPEYGTVCWSGLSDLYDLPEGAKKIFFTISDTALKEGHKYHLEEDGEVYCDTAPDEVGPYVFYIRKDTERMIKKIKGRKKYFYVELDYEV